MIYERESEGEHPKVHILWTEAYLWRGNGKERAATGGVIVTQGHCNVWAWAAARAHVWVLGPDATEMWFDVCSS